MSKEDFKQQALQITQENGNDFHFRTVEHLRTKGWYVTISPYYHDNFSEKPRELDLIAEKRFPVNRFGKYVGSVLVRLFVECKYVATTTVFWFDQKDTDAAEQRVLTDTRLQPKEKNVNILSHRYLENVPVAKLFASTNKQLEGEPMNKAIGQSLNALVYYKRIRSKLLKSSHSGDTTFTVINYPVILCNGFNRFYSRGLAEPEPITDNFQLELNYAYYEGETSKNEYFLVDVVSAELLDTFLEKLETTDIAIVGNYHAQLPQAEQ